MIVTLTEIDAFQTSFKQKFNLTPMLNWRHDGLVWFGFLPFTIFISQPKHINECNDDWMVMIEIFDCNGRSAFKGGGLSRIFPDDIFVTHWVNSIDFNLVSLYIFQQRLELSSEIYWTLKTSNRKWFCWKLVAFHAPILKSCSGNKMEELSWFLICWSMC